MINSGAIVVFDLETSGLSHIEDEPVQLAALVIDPLTLEIIPGSEFSSLMKPVNILSGTEKEIREKWNKSYKAWQVNGKTRKELEKAPLPEHVWKAFAAHVKKFSSVGKGKPIPAGHNIQGFDLLWADELSKRYKIADKHGRQQIFNTRIILDTMSITYSWFRNLDDGPESLSMDNLRPWLGISEPGHDALVDVKHSAAILIKFLDLQDRLANKVKFKNSFI